MGTPWDGGAVVADYNQRRAGPFGVARAGAGHGTAVAVHPVSGSSVRGPALAPRCRGAARPL